MPYPITLPKNLTPTTIPGLIWTIIQQTWKNKKVLFTEDRPRNGVDGPVITWKVTHRLPGKDGLEQYKPRLREEHVVSNQPVLRQRWAQWHTIFYQFDIYDVSDPDVNLLLEEFEDLIFSINGVLKQFGIDEFFFEEQFEDTTLQSVEQQVFVRSIKYRCFLDRVYYKDLPLIQELQLRTFQDMKEHIAVPIVRSTTDTDVIPHTWIHSLLSVANNPQVLVDDRADYLPGLDFNPNARPDGTAEIIWIPNRARPATGSTYYCCYRTFQPDTFPLTVSDTPNP